MKNLNSIAEELFNKIRGRFPSVTIGDAEGNVTNVPSDARFFDFDYKEGPTSLGKISITLSEENISVMYSNNVVANEDTLTRENWYNFLKELRHFSRKRMLNFDTRNITKSNLDRRDYQFLAKNRPGELTMESKMYGTSKTSYQNVGDARIAIKHIQPINQESATGRIQSIGKIYIESADGERFKYPFKHLNGARAMARHVAEGGKPFDDFGKHITSLSEELSKLKKFKTYMNRSAVMAEGLVEYIDVVNERISSVKKTITKLQKESYYKETFEGFAPAVMEDVPDDVKENWIDELTIRQFNEELQDVFPYIYKLVGEATRAKELGPDDLLGEEPEDGVPTRPGDINNIQAPARTVKIAPGMTIAAIARMFQGENWMGGDLKEFEREIMQMNKITDPSKLQVGQVLEVPYMMGTGRDGASRGLPRVFMAYEQALDSVMGQFGESDVCKECGNQSWTTLEMTEEEIEEACSSMKKKKKNESDVEEGEQHGNSKIYDKCWKGYRKVRGKKAGEKGSCKKIEGVELDADEGNAYADAVRQAKKDGKQKGDEIDGPDGKKIVLASEEQKTPLGEFILSYFDYTTGQFPKGETAILTMVEKDYGEQYITPAKQFLEKINHRVSEVMGYREEEPVEQDNTELNSIRSLAGL